MLYGKCTKRRGPENRAGLFLASLNSVDTTRRHERNEWWTKQVIGESQKQRTGGTNSKAHYKVKVKKRCLPRVFLKSCPLPFSISAGCGGGKSRGEILSDTTCFWSCRRMENSVNNKTNCSTKQTSCCRPATDEGF